MLCLVTKSKLRVERELSEEEAEAVRDPLRDDSTAELALAVLREGRENDLWLRCDCRIDIDDDPLVAPCRKAMSAGYSWRVLQGKNRPQHRADCVFYRESREECARRNWRRAARVPPEGYFEALRVRKGGNPADLDTSGDGTALTDPLHALGEEGDREPGRRRMPALAGLLYWLLETAGLTRVRANEPPPGIGGWTEAMSAAAKTIEVAPGHPLDGLLFPWRTGWDRLRVHARVREAARSFPKGHVPQGFVCFPVLHVGEKSLPATSKYGEVEVVSRIKRPTIGGRAVSGSYLFFGVVALTTRRRGYECVRGWAQPIVSVLRPVPVDSDYERQAFGTLTTTLRILSKEFPDAEFTMERPVFDIDTEQGACRPDFLIRARRNGAVRTWVVEVMGFDRPAYLAGKEVTHERMGELGPVILMDGKRFEAGLTDEGRKVTERIRADVEGSDSGDARNTDTTWAGCGSAPWIGAAWQAELLACLGGVNPDLRATPRTKGAASTRRPVRLFLQRGGKCQLTQMRREQVADSICSAGRIPSSLSCRRWRRS